MAKKITKMENIRDAVNANRRIVNKKEIVKVENALIYGEIPLRTYELLRNSFIGIK